MILDLFLVAPNLRLELVHNHVHRRQNITVSLTGHKIVLMLRRYDQLHDVHLVLQIDGDLDGREALEEAQELTEATYERTIPKQRAAMSAVVANLYVI